MVFTDEALITAAFRGMFGREIDADGMAHFTGALERGLPLAELFDSLVKSQEFSGRALAMLLPRVDLPDLTKAYPQRYSKATTSQGQQVTVFRAQGPQDFFELERQIVRNGYYDAFDGSFWPTVDESKHVTAEIARGLQANRVLEIGCFNGIVLGLLAEQGVEVEGVDASHLAFVLASPAVRPRIRFGDLLDVDLEGQFDVILAMDVLEHLNPVKFPSYFKRISELMTQDGFLFLCSPMFGTDRVFGQVAPRYLDGWARAGNEDLWLDLHCDDKGWPVHGHLVWQSPEWWEKQLGNCGLVRDEAVERRIHSNLERFYTGAPFRRGMFVVRKSGSAERPSVLASIDDTLRRFR